MKSSSIGSKLLAAALGVAATTAAAQVPGATGAPGMTSALAHLFGTNSAFTAKAEVRVLDSAQNEMTAMPMDFAMLDKKIRIDIDLTQAKSQNMPPGMADALKRMGMAQVVSIIRPDKKMMFVAYPDQKLAVSQAWSAEEADAAQQTPKITRTAMGQESLDGHACEKNKVVLTDAKGGTVEATTWNAQDLKDFPVQIQTSEGGTTAFIHFKGVQLVKPDSAQFDVPAGYTVYKSMQEAQDAIIKKAAAAQPGK